MPLPDFMHSPFRINDAAQHGFDPHQLHAMVDRGELTRLLRGVYQASDQADDHAARIRAVELLSTSMLVMVDRSAAFLHGIDLFSLAEQAVTPPVECCVLRGRMPPRRPELATMRRDLAPDEVQLIDGIRVTTPLRTALDLACSLSKFQGLWALDAITAAFAIDVAALEHELVRHGWRRGVVQARELVRLCDPASESSGETLTRLRLHEAGLPRPVAQHWVHDDHGRARYRLDLAYPWAKVAVEYDGVDDHSTPEQRRHDAERRAWLRARGWTIIVVTRRSFDSDALPVWINRVAQALRVR